MKTCSVQRSIKEVFPASRLAAALFRRHAALCPGCQLHLRQVQQLEARLSRPASSPAESLPAPLRDRLLARIAGNERLVWSQPSAPARWLPLRWALPLAGAAAACVFALLQFHPSSSTPAPPVTDLTLALREPIAVIQPVRNLPQLAGAVQEPLARELADSLVQSRILLAGMVRDTLPDPAAAAFIRETGLLPQSGIGD